jgi:hypothetical protein
MTKTEAITVSGAEPGLHIRRMTHGEFKAWVQENKDDSMTASTRVVAICVCDSVGKSPWSTKEAAIAAIDSWDWQVVRDISDQAIKFCGLGVEVKDAEKNS